MTSITDRPPLTRRQAEIYAWVVRHHDERGYAPTYRAIATAFQIQVNAAAETVRRLVRKGYLEIRKAPRGVIYVRQEVAA